MNVFTRCMTCALMMTVDNRDFCPGQLVSDVKFSYKKDDQANAHTLTLTLSLFRQPKKHLPPAQCHLIWLQTRSPTVAF